MTYTQQYTYQAFISRNQNLSGRDRSRSWFILSPPLPFNIDSKEGQTEMQYPMAKRGMEVVDEGRGTWFSRIFPIEKDDLSSRTLHRNIEYDKIISRHPSSAPPLPLEATMTDSIPVLR